MITNTYKTILTVLLAAALSGCSNRALEENETEHNDEEGIVEFTQAQFDQAGIKIGKIEERNIGSGLKVNGVIDVPPHGNISINLPYGGFLKSTEMLTGTKVKKGQQIAIIENPEFIGFQQEYQEALAQREFLQADFERERELFKEEVISIEQFQQSKSLYRTNEIRIKSFGEKLKLIGFNLAQISKGKTSALVLIYAPVPGFVKEVYANVGKYFSPKDAIMDITDTRDLHIELSVFENDIPKVHNGQSIHFTVASSPDIRREAEVFLIGKNVREDRSVTVHGHLEAEESDLLPGMYISANIVTGSHFVSAVPEEAAVRFQGKYYVYSFIGKVVENSQELYQFEMIEVNKGVAEDGFMQLDFADTDIDIKSVDIVTYGAFYVLSKAKNSGEGGHGH